MTEERRTYLIRIAALKAAVTAYPGSLPEHVVVAAKQFEQYLKVDPV